MYIFMTLLEEHENAGERGFVILVNGSVSLILFGLTQCHFDWLAYNA